MGAIEDVAGVDEAGRGPLAGPVVAAAVILSTLPPFPLQDSKKLTPAQRAYAFRWLAHHAYIGIGMALPQEIDRINILQATFLAMHRALENLRFTPKEIWIDGNHFLPWKKVPYRCIVGGDALCAPISAASIVAKHVRDFWMQEISVFYPPYGWERNKGYPTVSHYEALRREGPTPLHRKSFLRNLRTQ
ncbi:MAG: ribonuclease HII [Bacteroidia bacterium]